MSHSMAIQCGVSRAWFADEVRRNVGLLSRADGDFCKGNPTRLPASASQCLFTEVRASAD